jgi:hypothetical protein
MSNIYVEGKGPQGPQIKESLLPAAVSGYQRGLAVVYTGGSDGLGVTLAGAAAVAIGILEEDASATNNPVSVIEHGQAVAQIGANVTAGQQLAVNAAGQLIPAVSTNPVVAIALESQTYVSPGSLACVFVLGFGVVIHA